jgi:hypothetical protein
MFSEDKILAQPLPSEEERQRILERAKQVLEEARLTIDRLDRDYGMIPFSMLPASAGIDGLLPTESWRWQTPTVEAAAA